MSLIIQQQIDAYYGFSPRRYDVIETFLLKQAFNRINVMQQIISLVMKKSLESVSDEALYIDFYGVKYLKFTQPELSLISIPHLEILPTNDELKFMGAFYVHDPSQEQVIQFFCEDFQVATS